MPFTVACPGCRAPYAVKDEHRGLSLRCVRCQKVFPAVPATQPPAAMMAAPSAPPAPPAPPVPPPQPSASTLPDWMPEAPKLAAAPPPPPAPAATIPAPSTLQTSLPASPASPPSGDPFTDIDEGPAAAPRPRKASGPSFGQRLAPLGRRLLALPLKVKLGIAAGVLMMGMFFVIGVVVWAFSGGKTATPVAAVETRPDKAAPAPPPATRPALTANGELIEDIQKKVKRATVLIMVTNGPTGGGSGTGFFAIERGIILTNAHVLGMKEENSAPPTSIEVVLNSGEKDEKKIGGQILGVDRDNDLAVLKAVGWVGASSLPAPLDVKSAGSLSSAQTVWVFGFPLIDRLGKEISVSTCRVRALRKRNDVLHQVEVDGNMQPGNSGGPVVDAQGDVIGVAVSILVGRGINFAVPGEYVRSLLNGRCTGTTVGQAYTSNGKTLVPISVVKTDPLRKMPEVAIDVWAGQKGPPRVATHSTPPAMPADTPHTKTLLTRKEGEHVTEDVALPALPRGLVYWVQPRWTDGAGQAHWGPAAIWEMKSEPVERRPADLLVKRVEGNRPLSFHWVRTTKYREDDDDDPQTFTIKGELTESTQGVDRIRLQYRSFELSSTGPPPFQPAEVRAFERSIDSVKTDLRVDSRGHIQRLDSDLRGAPVGIRKKLEAVHNHVVLTLQAFSVPVPNGKANPMMTWKEHSAIPTVVGQGAEDTSLDSTYTYLGLRTRNGRQEAVIGVSGVVKGPGGSDAELSGKVEGVAVFDLADGQVSEVDARVSYFFQRDNPLGGGLSRGNGVIELTLRRAAR